MDLFALEHNLRNACERVTTCQHDVLSQRAQVRELERGHLDTSVARALLQIYEEAREMAVFNRDSLAQTMTMAQLTAAARPDPSIDEHEAETLYVDIPYRLAA
jgi:hypothetical protein